MNIWCNEKKLNEAYDTFTIDCCFKPGLKLKINSLQEANQFNKKIEKEMKRFKRRVGLIVMKYL